MALGSSFSETLASLSTARHVDLLENATLEDEINEQEAELPFYTLPMWTRPGKQGRGLRDQSADRGKKFGALEGSQHLGRDATLKSAKRKKDTIVTIISINVGNGR